MAKLVRVTGIENVYLCIPRAAIRRFDFNRDCAWVDGRRFKRHVRKAREGTTKGDTLARLRAYSANRPQGFPRLRVDSVFYSLPVVTTPLAVKISYD